MPKQISRKELKTMFPDAYKALEEDVASIPSDFTLTDGGDVTFTESDELYTTTYAWDGTIWNEVDADYV